MYLPFQYGPRRPVSHRSPVTDRSDYTDLPDYEERVVDRVASADNPVSIEDLIEDILGPDPETSPDTAQFTAEEYDRRQEAVGAAIRNVANKRVLITRDWKLTSVQ